MNVMERYGATPEMAEAIEKKEDYLLARIMAVHRERYEFVCALGSGFGRIKTGNYYGKAENFPTVGDFVEIVHNACGDSLIVRTFERHSVFARTDPSSSGHWEQAVAANFDYVFLLQSLNANFNVQRLERYLTLAWQSGAEPVVVLTKADLKEDISAELAAAVRVAGAVDVHAVSALTGQGMEELKQYMQPGKTIVFLGSSGVGKSSLVNALAGKELMETGEIRESDGKGRHTTTYRQLILNENGTMFIDTPGMRALGMWDVTEGLGQTFSDVEELAKNCRFRDCRHQNEPGCAVQAAIASGKLSPRRLASYQKLKREAKYSEDRPAYYRDKRAACKKRGGHG